MGGVGFTEMLLLAVILLIVVGPEKLPRMARTAGKLTRQARNAWQGLQSELQAEMDAEHNRKIMQAHPDTSNGSTAESAPAAQHTEPGNSGRQPPASDEHAKRD